MLLGRAAGLHVPAAVRLCIALTFEVYGRGSAGCVSTARGRRLEQRHVSCGEVLVTLDTGRLLPSPVHAEALRSADAQTISHRPRSAPWAALVAPRGGRRITLVELSARFGISRSESRNARFGRCCVLHARGATRRQGDKARGDVLCTLPVVAGALSGRSARSRLWTTTRASFRLAT